MARIAVFLPIVTLDLDTKEVTVDFSSSFDHVDLDDGASTQATEVAEEEAGPALDAILGTVRFDNPAEEQAANLRRLADHIDPPGAPSISASPEAGLDGILNVLTRLTESPVRLAYDFHLRDGSIVTGILSETVSGDQGDVVVLLDSEDESVAIAEIPLADVTKIVYC